MKEAQCVHEVRFLSYVYGYTYTYTRTYTKMCTRYPKQRRASREALLHLYSGKDTRHMKRHGAKENELPWKYWGSGGGKQIKVIDRQSAPSTVLGMKRPATTTPK